MKKSSVVLVALVGLSGSVLPSHPAAQVTPIVTSKDVTVADRKYTVYDYAESRDKEILRGDPRGSEAGAGPPGRMQ